MLSFVIFLRSAMRATSRESDDLGSAKWKTILRANLGFAKKFFRTLTSPQRLALKTISRDSGLSLAGGGLRLIDGNWYVTHAGLMHLSARNRCHGIDVRPVVSFCDAPSSRWAFKATVYKSSKWPWFRRIWRRQSVQCLSPRPWRRDACGRNPCGERGPA
jgi:hypothetical protein